MRRSYPRYLCKVPRTTTAHRQRASRDAHTSMALQGHLCSCPGRSSSFIRLIPLSRGPNGEGLQPRTPRGVPEVAAGLALIPTYCGTKGAVLPLGPFRGTPVAGAAASEPPQGGSRGPGLANPLLGSPRAFCVLLPSGEGRNRPKLEGGPPNLGDCPGNASRITLSIPKGDA